MSMAKLKVEPVEQLEVEEREAALPELAAVTGDRLEADADG